MTFFSLSLSQMPRAYQSTPRAYRYRARINDRRRGYRSPGESPVTTFFFFSSSSRDRPAVPPLSLLRAVLVDRDGEGTAKPSASKKKPPRE